MTGWYISMPHATFAIEVEDGHVTAAPPIARWMIGRKWHDVRVWVMGRGGHGEPL